MASNDQEQFNWYHKAPNDVIDAVIESEPVFDVSPRLYNASLQEPLSSGTNTSFEEGFDPFERTEISEPLTSLSLNKDTENSGVNFNFNKPDLVDLDFGSKNANVQIYQFTKTKLNYTKKTWEWSSSRSINWQWKDNSRWRKSGPKKWISDNFDWKSFDFFYQNTEELVLDNDKWNFNYCRRTPKYILELEEQERQDRLSRGYDPVLLGKWHNIQREFMWNWNNNWAHLIGGLVKSSSRKLTGKLNTMRDNIHLRNSFEGVVDSVMNKATGLVESAKDTLGIYDVNSISGLNKIEEKERQRRMQEKHDPLIEARKRRMEHELMETIKPAC